MQIGDEPLITLDARGLIGETAGVTFLLAHLSDPHIGPLPVPLKRELIGKRFTGWLNWRGGRNALHDMQVLKDLVADVQAHAPDHIAVTGDILNIGLPAEFPLAAAWLETVGAPHDVSFVPGNHDAYTRGSMPHLARTFAAWTRSDDGSAPSYPYVRIREEVALIGLSSGVPTGPFLASGRMGAAQRRAFARTLDELGARGLCRVVMIHHPPYRRGATPGRGLSDARAFEAIIARHGAELVVHGHNHRHLVEHLPGPRGPVPVVGVASASAVPGTPHHRAAYHLFTLARMDGHWKVAIRARGLLPGTRVIGDVHVPPL